MAAQEEHGGDEEQESSELSISSTSCINHKYEELLCLYLGLSFTIFLGFLPKLSISLVSTLQTHNRNLTRKLIQAEEQLSELHSRRKEDSKANARVVEIFASHRHAWQQEEKRLLHQIHGSAEEIAHLRARVEELEHLERDFRAKVEDLKREVGERDEMLNFMTRPPPPPPPPPPPSTNAGDYYGLGFVSRFGKVRVSDEVGINNQAMEECFNNNNNNADEMDGLYAQTNLFNPEFSSSFSKFWEERPNLCQDVQYESVESVHDFRHYLGRRESPWKVDGDSSGVSSKLKLLEQELLNLERIGTDDLLNLPSLMRKQAKRYQALAGKIDDLCRRMQASDPCEPNASLEFRTQRQTEFLMEAFRLQQRATETGQKLLALQTETGKGYYGDDLMEGQAKLITRHSFNSIRNNFRDIQRNLEIWLARIIGDVEGILVRDGASRVNDYYIPRYPFVQ